MKKLFGVLGDPISHSMSPVMHNDLFKLYNLDAVYLPFHVTSSKLEDAIKGLKALGAAGFNVTIPHKTSIIPFLDKVEPLAAAIGAVNTVVNEDGKFVGYNTDGSGYLEGLKMSLNPFEVDKVLIIGAGGAARAIYFTLADAGIKHIDITNRSIEKAVSLIESCPYPVNSQPLKLDQVEDLLTEYDLVVQTTPIGMAPGIDKTPLSLNKVHSKTFISDIIYNPLETRFLAEAREKGCLCQNGIEMFVLQGALAFEKWTGISPDLERMRNNVLTQLGGTTC